MKTTTENRLERLLRFYRFNSDLFSDNEELEILARQKIIRIKALLAEPWKERSDHFQTKKLERWLSIQ